MGYVRRILERNGCRKIAVLSAIPGIIYIPIIVFPLVTAIAAFLFDEDEEFSMLVLGAFTAAAIGAIIAFLIGLKFGIKFI
ncbi:MAG: hypothetical protein QW728_06925 [Thermoplasmata archaeon]